jgi:hypothetical protein
LIIYQKYAISAIKERKLETKVLILRLLIAAQAPKGLGSV